MCFIDSNASNSSVRKAERSCFSYVFSFSSEDRKSVV